MEQFYVFANSEDSLNIFNDNAGGRFRIYFPNPSRTGSWAAQHMVLKSVVGNIFVQDTQRLENGNVRILDIGIIHKITTHIDPSRRCG
jgi:hypothetical protein